MENGDQFGGLDKYIIKINTVGYLGPFIIETCSVLLRNADHLACTFSSVDVDGVKMRPVKSPVTSQVQIPRDFINWQSTLGVIASNSSTQMM